MSVLKLSAIVWVDPRMPRPLGGLDLGNSFYFVESASQATEELFDGWDDLDDYGAAYVAVQEAEGSEVFDLFPLGATHWDGTPAERGVSEGKAIEIYSRKLADRALKNSIYRQRHQVATEALKGLWPWEGWEYLGQGDRDAIRTSYRYRTPEGEEVDSFMWRTLDPHQWAVIEARHYVDRDWTPRQIQDRYLAKIEN